MGGALDPAARRAPERFALKLVTLLVFALAEAPRGFRRALGQLSLLTAVISGLLGAFDRERPAAPSLNHWDEAAMFLGPGLLIRGSG